MKNQRVDGFIKLLSANQTRKVTKEKLSKLNQSVKMFKNPFKQKSQISLRSSEKKKFLADLKTAFPALTDEDIDAMNNSKENIVKLKVTTHKQELAEIYCLEKVPILIDFVDAEIKLPTVFLCWKFPHIVPEISIKSILIQKLQNGADLFCPGVIFEGLRDSQTDFKTSRPVCINTSKNKAAVAVGLSQLSKQEILENSAIQQKGKAVKVYHVIGDYLHKIQPDAKVPEMGAPEWAQPVLSNLEVENKDEPEINDEKLNSCDSTTPEEKVAVENDEAVANKEETEKNNEEAEKDKVNEILEYCFMKALKSVPKSSYPMLPATFYANHVLKSLSEGQELNIKKTKWKKFSTFIQEKALQGLIKLQPIQRGEFTISGVETDHKLIREFIDPYDKPIVVEPVSRSDKPSMLQVFTVSAATVPFFSKLGMKKNDEMTKTDVKVHLNDYIKRENLVHPEHKEKVLLDPVLCEVFKGHEVLSRADLLAKLLEKMNVRFKISSTPNVVHKGKMPVIDFEVFTRNKNKKVTVISNLESYGVNVNIFSKELQQKAAASTTIINPTVPDKKGPQVQVQGNQISIALSILKEQFNISEKFMRGLEKAVKAKKK